PGCPCGARHACPRPVPTDCPYPARVSRRVSTRHARVRAPPHCPASSLELLRVRDAGALRDMDQLVRRHAAQFLDLAQGPANLQVHLGDWSEAEMQARVVT